MNRWRFFLVFLVIFFFIGAYSRRIKNPPVIQPIKYNHKVHIENGLVCEDCHQYVKTRQKATLPQIDVCMACHEEPLTDSGEEAKIRKYAETTGQIPWKRILLLGDHIYFSHRRHVSIGKIDCNTCHGEMAQREKPPTRPLKRMEMKDCIACHKKREITYDCNACHR